MMAANEVIFETVQPDAYDLGYTCLLLPRCAAHLLQESGMTAALEQWIREICASYGGKVDFLSICPDYVEWNMRVVPSLQIGQFMKDMRAKTSELLFANFTITCDEDAPQGEFWSPGYFVVLGSKPLPREIIEQYIRLAKRHP